MNQTKECIWCKAPARPRGRLCRKCTDYDHHYGTNVLEVEWMRFLQEYKCAIEACDNKAVDLDHCHKTGKIRKLLCPKCNKSLGLLDDNPAKLISMLNYLSTTV